MRFKHWKNLYSKLLPLPIISPFTLFTASRRPSTRPATSFAKRFLPSSLTLSASSLLFASSNSSGVRVIDPDSRNDLKTGEDAIVDDVSKEVR